MRILVAVTIQSLIVIKIIEWFEIGSMILREKPLDDQTLSKYVREQVNKAEYDYKSTPVKVFYAALIV